jgi:hypothetical protein
LQKASDTAFKSISRGVWVPAYAATTRKLPH